MIKSKEDLQDEESLCDFCPLTDYGCRFVKINTNQFNQCEGSSCDEAYEHYKENFEEEMKMFEIEKVIYNGVATIVWFADGEKVVVKCSNEAYDEEKGVAMAIVRRLYTRNQFKKMVKDGTEQPNKVKKLKRIRKYKGVDAK